jgi:protein O-mannosyl-transferase
VSTRNPLVAAICGFLALAVLVVFAQTLQHGFVNFDDDLYVYANRHVMRGLAPDAVAWAFTHTYAVNWHPLTWISHMLDVELYGLDPGGHHLTSVVLHGAVVIVLFLFLREATGAVWPSAFVAAVFAVHPLRAESVAWIAERKDVLCGLFFVLTLTAYVRYARNPSSWRAYIAVVTLFGLGLMCKPMLMTLPVVLLLLDYWPLRRLTGAPQLGQLVLEKGPLLALAVASCAITLVGTKPTIRSFEEVPLALRLENAAVSYVAYLGQMVYPVGLAPFYPYSAAGVTPFRVVGALILLAIVSGAAFAVRRERPYVLVGWLWYLVMLLPVIGIVQVGAQARADRYTYLPQIGVYLVLAWAVAEACRSSRRQAGMLGIVGAGIVATFMACAHEQVSHWRNSETLWRHTLAWNDDNSVAHNNLGATLLDEGRVDEAIGHFRRALQINPRNAFAYNNLGAALIRTGRPDEAVGPFTTALEIDPQYADAYNGLGNALLETNRVGDAAARYRKALDLDPEHAEAHNGLGNAFLRAGRVDDAIAQYDATLALDPRHVDAYNGIGNALLRSGRVDDAIAQYARALAIDPRHVLSQNGIATALVQAGRVDEAIGHWEQALRLDPNFPSACNNFAWVLSTAQDPASRNGARAIELAERASRLAGGQNPLFLATLAAAYAEGGRFDDAVRVARAAIDLATATGQAALASQTAQQLRRYENALPLHQ